MNTASLVRKEWMEAVRTYKVIFVPLVFILLGIGQPLSFHFMPQLLQYAGLPEGTVIDIPAPAPAEIVASALDQFNQLGVLIIVLAAMGIIAREVEFGQAGFVVTLGLSRWRYLGIKWAMLSAIVVTSVVLGTAAAAYYTVLLFGSLAWSKSLVAALIYSLYTVFVLTVALVFSAASTNQLAAGGSALMVTVVFGLLGMILHRTAWLPSEVTRLAKQVLQDPSGFSWSPLGVVSAWIVAALIVAYLVLRHREL